MAKPLKALESHLHYTVGWVAPLPIERAAAKAIFDEEHGRPTDFEQPREDPNSYCWGEIGGHNIVLASLKAGVSGPASATSSAIMLLRSFPEIRFGLLVGIGGAIPHDDTDIRLGDIVVGQPSGSEGGVIQYDLLKAKAGGAHERKDFLNSPPEVLLYALVNLQSQHEEQPSRVSEFLREMEQRNPYMFKTRPNYPGYKYPGQSQDRLFLSTYDHQGGTDCRDCTSTEEVQRDPREDTDPVIHYGVIASGSTLVKDASEREKLLQHIPANCLCYEMEAAGLVNNFPCLVIRGISDYSDSHKNDLWQRYASATAAAYAKELLSHVSAVNVRYQQKALNVMNEQMSIVQSDISDVKQAIFSWQQRTRIEEITTWLSPADTRTSHARAKNKHAGGSCAWFLQGEAFRSWRRAHGSFMWVHGIVGCGKTILTSAIIESLKTEECGDHCIVLYFYFDFGSAWNCLNGIVRTLLCQIMSAKSEIPKSLQDNVKTCQQRWTHAETQALLEDFYEMISPLNEVRIVLDALDEVKGEDREDILSWITEIFRIQGNRISLIVLSRHESTFQSRFKGMGVHVPISRSDVDCDIQRYIQAKLLDIRVSRGWTLAFDEIKELELALMERANGMFRLAALQMDSLLACGMPRELRQAVVSLPASLTGMYDEIIRQIRPERKITAIRLLQLLAYAKRPLRLDEVADAIVVDSDKSPSFQAHYRMFRPEDLPDYCPSLVILEEFDELDSTMASMSLLNQRKRLSDVDQDAQAGFYSMNQDATPERQWISNRTLSMSGREAAIYPPSRYTQVRLAHFSVTEYLRSDKMRADIREELEEERVHSIFVDLSLKYLVSLNTIRQNTPVSVVRRDYPFSDYASSWWPQHAKACEQDQTTQNLVVQFLTDPQAFQRWVFVFKPDGGYRYLPCTSDHNEVCLSDSGIEIPSPLQVAVTFGLRRAVRALLDSGVPLFEGYTSGNCDKYDHEQLQAFSVQPRLYGPWERRHSPIVRTSPLYMAARYGWEDIAKLLLQKGLTMQDHDGPEGSSFDIACRHGHDALVSILLPTFAAQQRVNHQFDPHVAHSFIHGHWKVLKILLNAGACFPPGTFEFQTDSRLGYGLKEQVMSNLEAFILEKISWVDCPTGASVVKGAVRSKDTLKSLAELAVPFVAASSDSHRIDTIILSDGALSGLELHIAVQRCDETFLSAVLPRHKHRFKAHDHKGKSPLHYAAELGHANMIRFLISTGFPLEDMDKAVNKPLSYALMNSRLDALDLLSSNQHAIEEERMRLQKQAEIIAAIDNEDLQKLTDFYGVDARVSFVKEDAEAKGAFRHAVLNNAFVIIDFLLSNKLNPLVGDADGCSPYKCALETGNFNFVKMFPLDDTSERIFVDRYGHLPHAFVQGNGAPGMRKWLLKKAVELNARRQQIIEELKELEDPDDEPMVSAEMDVSPIQ